MLLCVCEDDVQLRRNELTKRSTFTLLELISVNVCLCVCMCVERVERMKCCTMPSSDLQMVQMDTLPLCSISELIICLEAFISIRM